MQAVVTLKLEPREVKVLVEALRVYATANEAFLKDNPPPNDYGVTGTPVRNKTDARELLKALGEWNRQNARSE
jgi:hypothetical protein